MHLAGARPGKCTERDAYRRCVPHLGHAVAVESEGENTGIRKRFASEAVVGLWRMIGQERMDMFRALRSSEVDGAYALWLSVFDWLREKGVRQWLEPLPRAAFVASQERGELCGYFGEQQLAAVVTLASEDPQYWPLETRTSSRLWMKSLAVDRCFGGHGIGEAVIRSCETAATQRGKESLWLDCVESGFLPAYYGRYGYLVQASRAIACPSGDVLLMVRMKKNLRVGIQRPPVTGAGTVAEHGTPT
jgi:ribosomal protein S18 acetylase RimI-like enzyme